MDRLASMAVFVKATETGSFASAAAALGLSPQMVAKHVAMLEARLGARLLARTTRRQSLTAVGRTYFERCKSVLAEAEWADALAQETSAAPRGQLRVSAPVSFGAHGLMPLVTRFLREHSEVTVDLVLSDRHVDLVEEGFEAAFRIGPLGESGLIARALAPFRVVCCASPAYLRERGKPATPAELSEHECLGYAHGPRLDAWLFAFANGTVVAPVRPRLHLNNARALLSAALDGFGIVMVAADMASEALHAGRLVRILENYEPPTRPMHLLYLADRRQTPKLRRFIDATLQTFGPGRSES